MLLILVIMNSSAKIISPRQQKQRTQRTHTQVAGVSATVSLALMTLLLSITHLGLFDEQPMPFAPFKVDDSINAPIVLTLGTVELHPNPLSCCKFGLSNEFHLQKSEAERSSKVQHDLNQKRIDRQEPGVLL